MKLLVSEFPWLSGTEQALDRPHQPRKNVCIANKPAHARNQILEDGRARCYAARPVAA